MREWATLPATRHFFRILVDQLDMWSSVGANAYTRGNIDSSFGVLAESSGARSALIRLINSVHVVKDHTNKTIDEFFIFSQSDREEAGYGKPKRPQAD